MKRMFDFWVWAISEQLDSFLLFITTAILTVIIVLFWFFTSMALLLSGSIIYGGVLLLGPVFLILMRGAKEYNKTNPTETKP
jgi:hypothetical protein